NVSSIKFKNAKIPVAGGKYSISNPESFVSYWKTIFGGPSGTTRSMALKSTRVVDERDGIAIVEATYNCTSHPSWIFITILFNLLILLIIYFATRTTETITVRKVMVRREDRWFVLESGLQGPLDKINEGTLATVLASTAPVP